MRRTDKQITDRCEIDAIMRHYSGREWNFEPLATARVRTWAISIVTMTCKRSPPGKTV
ncbi:MAG: hypothetical protein KJ579_06320 [Verrucomicrobia bacterium]|nr:hypothetical protein [Verrucomicrobiota bacterium]